MALYAWNVVISLEVLKRHGANPNVILSGTNGSLLGYIRGDPEVRKFFEGWRQALSPVAAPDCNSLQVMLLMHLLEALLEFDRYGLCLHGPKRNWQIYCDDMKGLFHSIDRGFGADNAA